MTPHSTMAKLLGTPPRIFMSQITDNELPDKTKVDSHSFWLMHPRRRSEFSRTRLKQSLITRLSGLEEISRCLLPPTDLWSGYQTRLLTESGLQKSSPQTMILLPSHDISTRPQDSRQPRVYRKYSPTCRFLGMVLHESRPGDFKNTEPYGYDYC